MNTFSIFLLYLRPMKNQHKQQGSAHLVIILILAIALVGALGYIFWQNIVVKKPSDSTAQTTHSTATSSTTPKTSLTSDSVKTTVSAFYAKYLTAFKHTNDPNYPGEDPDSAGMKAAVAQYGTANFVSFYDNFKYTYDPVLCAQNYPTTGPDVTNVDIVSNKAKVTVTQDFSSPGATPNPKTLTVNVSDVNGPKIDSITCPSLQ